MKTFTTFGVITALLASHQAMSSALVVQAASAENIVVSLDHGEYTLPGRSVEFHEVRPGTHVLKVYKLVYHGPVHGNRPSRLPSRKEIYRGSLFIPAGTRVQAEVERRQIFLTYTEWPVLNAACIQPAAMSDGLFHRLLRSIDSKTFESSKLATARQAASGNNFTACQVAELLTLFTFESTKLEFAKLAYGRTVDPMNYFQVFDAFTFESSIAELQQFTESLLHDRLTGMHGL